MLRGYTSCGPERKSRPWVGGAESSRIDKLVMVIVPTRNGFVVKLFNMNFMVRKEDAKNETHGISVAAALTG